MKKLVLAGMLATGIAFMCNAYVESHNSTNGSRFKAEDVGTIGLTEVGIDGSCASNTDKDYYAIVPNGSTLACLAIRGSKNSNRYSASLLDASGGFVAKLMDAGTETYSEISVTPGATYYVYVYGLGSNSFFGEDYQIWLACDGGGGGGGGGDSGGGGGGGDSGGGGGWSKSVDLRPYTPSDWMCPILVTTSSSSTTEPSSITEDDYLYIKGAVVGSDTVSSSFSNTLYLDGEKVVTWTAESLRSGYYTHNKNAYALGRLSPGSHKLKLKADSASSISETDESNNEFTRTIYVESVAKTYTVEFSKNDGSGVTKTQKHTVGSSKRLLKLGSQLGWSRSGYKFLGWSRSSTATSATWGNGEKVRDLATTAGATVTLYAVWRKKAVTYTVKYDRNDGSGATKTQKHTVGSSRRLLKLGSQLGWNRSGCKFLGWSKSRNATKATWTNGEKVRDLTTKSGATVTLYAVWQAQYSVCFNYNANAGGNPMKTGGSKALAPVYRTFTIGRAQRLPKVGSELGWRQIECRFLGWSKSPTAKTATWKNGEKVKDLTTKPGATVSLYAIWQRK